MHSMYLTEEQAKQTRKTGTRAAVYLLSSLLHGSALLKRAIPENKIAYITNIYCFDKFTKPAHLFSQTIPGLYCLNCQRMHQIPKVGTYCLTCPHCSGRMYNNAGTDIHDDFQVFQASHILDLIARLDEKDQTFLWILLGKLAIRRGDYVTL